MVTSLFTDIIKDQRGPEYKPQTKIVAGHDRQPAHRHWQQRRIEDGRRAWWSNWINCRKRPGMARVFKLTMADASTMVTVVSNAMVRFDARNRPIRLVSVSADEKSNSLIVSGSRAELQDAQAIIERLDGEGVEKGRTC